MSNNNAVASQAPEVLPTPEVYWQYWEGQRKINGLLFAADTSLIAAINELKKVAAKILEVNAITGLEVELNQFERAIEEAKHYAGKVPGVNPPGCVSPPY